MKRQRASLPGFDESDIRKRMNEQNSPPTGAASSIPGIGIMGPIGEILGAVSHGQQEQPSTKSKDPTSSPHLESTSKSPFGGPLKPKAEEDDEEL